MVLGAELLKVLNKLYEPSRLIETTFKRYDIAFKTDAGGRPILLFMGKRDENGKIRGEHFARRLKFGPNGEVVKDHWDNKGKIA
ncbi:hypothetical protein [Mucilaginibacter phyllosphaerae]|uniref:Uncharacterized protein n=1 Tax=Mucilaginibacter phyllosphaerae TaxID=1812349 RepID=A0A4Y8AIT8_9SPHI|nr:hypothetical protein [Mucilaginibacter phyllosphaerae]MBB3967998.1 hypothetical protein [Mucilaginibacter phyllosphaerae]TEW68976.1 hypothetical protein E2R65_02075 [Mucilaginibacter phyllosphaerae]GGH01933.1 hypothetical protein GCM10007352_03890 [Mucilaginibacter phyllosphaerae]